jgi:peroxiredoxin
MRARFPLTSTLLAAAAGLLLAGPARAGDKTPAAKVGKTVPDLTFTDARGASLRLHDLKEQKAIVLVFLSFDCPVSNSYCRPLADLHAEYHKYGVTILGLTANQDQSRKEVAREARHYNLPFPVYLDKGLAAADALKATTTPEVFVLDGTFALRYRGRIDDAWAARLKSNHKPATGDLRQAVAELLSGRPVSNPVTRPVGCTILREEPAARAGPVTYYRDVLPILQNRCQECHRPGEVGPFSLLTYRQAVNWAADIKEYTRLRQMPPWKITAGVAFDDDRRMPEKEIATLAAWVDAGTPAGDRKDAPPPRQFPAQGWRLGQPDLVLTLPEDFQVGPSGKDIFRCFVLPTNLTEDRYVAAVDVRPGNPRVVHHSLLFVDATGQGRKLEQKAQSKKGEAEPHGGPAPDKGPGYSVGMGVGFVPQGGLSGWAPGHLARFLPDGFGYFLPKGADVVMQVHYHRNGRPEKDRTRVGLYFAKGKDTRPIQGGTLFGSQGGSGAFRLFFSIPAGEERFPLKGSQWARDDFTLYAITPHMHLLGKSIKLTMTPPGGPTKTLLEIADWDYNWQEAYHLKEPVRVPAGSRLDVEAVYDNSDGNPNNPFSPPRRVSFGEQTTNEMCFVFLGGASVHRGRRLPLSRTDPAKSEQRTPARGK